MRILLGMIAGIGVTIAWVHYWRRILWALFAMGD